MNIRDLSTLATTIILTVSVGGTYAADRGYEPRWRSAAIQARATVLEPLGLTVDSAVVNVWGHGRSQPQVTVTGCFGYGTESRVPGGCDTVHVLSPPVGSGTMSGAHAISFPRSDTMIVRVIYHDQ